MLHILCLALLQNLLEYAKIVTLMRRIAKASLAASHEILRTEWSFIMNKKEALEIRKQFSPENCAITRICGCYVNGDKEKQMEFKEAFLSLPDEETFNDFEIF